MALLTWGHGCARSRAAAALLDAVPRYEEELDHYGAGTLSPTLSRIEEAPTHIP